MGSRWAYGDPVAAPPRPGPPRPAPARSADAGG
jgi:hypothetical protein